MNRYFSILSLVFFACAYGCDGNTVSGGKGGRDDAGGGDLDGALSDDDPKGEYDGPGDEDLTPDTTPPDIASVTATSHTSVLVVFSEGLLSESVAAEHFHIQGAEGAIAVHEAALLNDGMSVELDVAAGMLHGHTYTLTVQGVADLAENVMAERQHTFAGRGLVVAVLSGVPAVATPERAASISVGGDDIVAYRYALGGPELSASFSAEIAASTPIALQELEDGAYTLEVLGKDSLGNWQSPDEPTRAQWVVDNVPPTAVILSGPPSVTSDRNAVFSIGGAGVVAFAYELNGGERSEEVPVDALMLPLMPAGSHTLHVFGRDAAGNWQPSGEPTVYTWTVDYSLPIAVLDGLPDDPTNATQASISVGGEGVVAYRYRLDGGDWSEPRIATDPIALDGLADGVHLLEVLGRDIYDGWQVEALPTSHTWRVDTEPPVAVLANTPPALTSQTEVEISVGGDDVHVYVFALDGASFSEPLDAEELLRLTDLTEGVHVVEVLAADRAGNWQTVPTIATWEVDFTAPTALLSGVPPFYSNVTSASFSVSGAEIVAYVVSIDDAAFSDEQPVATPIELEGLTEGPHSVAVLGRDLAGNWQSEDNATRYSWHVDLTAPTALVINGPLDPTNVTSASFDIGGEDVEAYRFKLDDGVWSDERDVGEPAAFFGLAEGTHTFWVVGRDVAGNWQKEEAATSFTWAIDLSPPVAVLQGLPHNPTNDTSLGVSVGGAGVVAYRYSLDGAAWSDAIPQDQDITALDLEEGTHTLAVVAKDQSGNWQSTSEASTFTWVVDLTAPQATWSGLPADPTRQTTVAILIGGADVVQYRYKLDDAPWTGRFDVAQTLALSELSEGQHTLRVAGIDLAGNDDLSAPLTHTWTVDVTPPSASLSAVAPASSPTNSLAFELTVGGDDVVAYRVRIDSGAWSEETPVATAAAGTVVGEGEHVVEVVGRDTAGNWQAFDSATAFTWSVDLTPPVASLGNLPAPVTNVTSVSATVGGDDVVAYRYRLNGGAPSVERAVELPITLSGLDVGEHLLEVVGRDAVGNWQAWGDATSYTWEIDLTAPTAVLSGVPNAITNVTSASIVVSGAAAYSYSLNGGAWSSFVDVSTPLTLSGLADGAYTLRVVGRDEAMNEQEESNATTYSWTVDTVAPSAALSGTPAALTQNTNASVTVGGAGVTHYQYRLDGGAWSAERAVATLITLTDLSDGAHSLEVVGRDAAGNWQSSATSHTWTVDTTAPTPPSVSDTVDTIGNAGVYDDELSLTFSWNNPADAAMVAIQIATNASFTNIVHGGSNGANVGTAESYTYVADPANGSRYYARVRVRDAAGNWSSFGAASDGIDIVGGVAGKVMTSSLTDLSGATVRLERASDSGLVASTTTNASGSFSFANVPIGALHYRLVVSRTGYSSATKNNVSVFVGATTDIGVIYLVSSSASSGRIYGKVVDANDGASINNATITVRNWTGDVVRTVTSGSNGDFSTGNMNLLTPGTYSITISKVGYFDLVVDNVIVDGHRNVERQALCEILSEPHVRTVLLWGSAPADLDLHVVGPSAKNVAPQPNNRFHVHWRNAYKSFNENTGNYVVGADPTGTKSTTSLVQDDTNGYGPEAINLFGYGSGYANGVYTYTVHKYSSGGTWYDNPVTIRLYDSQGMVQEIPIPNGAGNLRYWRAFKLNIQGASRAQRTLTLENSFATLDYESKSSMNW